MEVNIDEKLQNLVQNSKLEEAIQITENELRKYQQTDFPKAIGKNLLHQIDELGNYLKSFTTEMNERISLKCVYGEMNGFSINYEYWFVDFFGFDFVGEPDDISWLADYDDENASIESFPITGFEEIQEVYRYHHKNKLFENEDHEEASDVCELLIILRLQQLFHETLKMGKMKNEKWADLLIMVKTHDSELLYRIN